MTPRYLLDTDVISYIVKRNPPEYARRLASIPPDLTCVSAVSEAELLFGLQLRSPDHWLRRAIPETLTQFEVLPWDRAVARHYAEIQYFLTSTGQWMGEMDVLIAAHALAIGAVRVTGNVRHHARIPGLEIIDWRD